MENFVREYVRVVNSIFLDETSKENMFNKITENMASTKNETKKQIAVASVAAVAAAVCISYFFRSCNKMR